MSTSSQSYLAGLIGSGVTISLTPPMHEAEADHHGLRCIYRPIDLDVLGRPADAVGDLVRAGRDGGPADSWRSCDTTLRRVQTTPAQAGGLPSDP